MTNEELERRIKEICDEMGIEPERQELKSSDGEVLGETFAFDKNVLETLDPEKRARLEQLRHELLVDATGTRITFSTRLIELGQHNIAPDAEEPVVREWIELSVDAEDLHSVFALATAGAAMLAQATGRRPDPLQVAGILSSICPDKETAARTLYKLEELGAMIGREHKQFHDRKAIEELAGFADGDLFVSDITGEED